MRVQKRNGQGDIARDMFQSSTVLLADAKLCEEDNQETDLLTSDLSLVSGTLLKGEILGLGVEVVLG